MPVGCVSHPVGYQRLNIPCMPFAYTSSSSQILHVDSRIPSRQSPAIAGSVPSFSGYFTSCMQNRRKLLALQVFGCILKGLSCSSSSLPCSYHKISTIKDGVQSSSSSGLFSVSSTPESLVVNSAGKRRRMSIAHALTGQCLKPGLFFSAFRFGKLSRQWLKRGSDCFNSRCEGTGALWNQSWKMAFSGNSLWFLFGLCTCSIAASTGPLLGPPALAEPLVERSNADGVGTCGGTAVIASAASHGKKVLTNYSVIGIPGDGRCLFRAVAHGAHMQKGMGMPSETLQRESADILRGKVVDELVKRREETEWFIEGDFDSYTKRMKQPHVWGGEPELLMASHVLRMPITVYMFEPCARGLIPIAEYGQEYMKENPVPIRVLYHGFGHYDSLEVPNHEI